MGNLHDSGSETPLLILAVQIDQDVIDVNCDTFPKDLAKHVIQEVLKHGWGISQAVTDDQRCVHAILHPESCGVFIALSHAE